MSDIAQLESLVHLGHYARARNLAHELLSKTDDLRAKQLYALSLSKSGVPEAAQEYLEGVAKDHPDDPETMGILGSIYKELFKKNKSPKFATLSRDTYEKNFQLTKSYYTGINAAAMSMLAGQARRGKEIAAEVLTILKNPEYDFWEAATQAEAYLLLKERPKAEESYRHARSMASTDWGKVSSVYNQLWLLKHYLPVPAGLLTLFSPPVVVSFTGHMIDRPGRPSPRFPASIEPEIKRDIQAALRKINAKIGYCSLACGSDILFAEAMEEEGGEVNLFLPFRLEDFVESSINFAGQQWVDRFHRLVNKHPVTYLTQEGYENHPDLFNLTAYILFGLSALRSSASHGEPTLLMVLSERDLSKRMGGVRDTLSLWPYPKNRVTINPDIYVSDNRETEGSTAREISERPVLYMVCCDLPDEKVKATLLENMDVSSIPPVVFEVKEKQLIAGFKTILGAMEFCDLIAKVSVWPFQQKNTVRISMHVGPVRIDPLKIEQPLTGTSIVALERLHSMTIPGSIYTTAFVAAILALDVDKYSFDYVDTLTAGENSKDLDIFKVGVHKVL